MAEHSLQRIYLEPNMVPAALRGGYQGKKFKACVCTDMTIPNDAGLWSGGTRDVYSVVRLEDGKSMPATSWQGSHPYGQQRQDTTVKLEPGIAVVQHSMFCGKDMGLTFYVHPDNAAKLIPAQPTMLTAHERLVLTATASLKSSYAGRDRYENARGEYHCVKALNGADYPTREQWDLAKHNLIQLGLLNKAAAITPAGRNAVPRH